MFYLSIFFLILVNSFSISLVLFVICFEIFQILIFSKIFDFSILTTSLMFEFNIIFVEQMLNFIFCYVIILHMDLFIPYIPYFLHKILLYYLMIIYSLFLLSYQAYFKILKYVLLHYQCHLLCCYLLELVFIFI